LRPERAVLAPDLTLGLPRSITVASGLDALTHGVEAATGQRATSSVVEIGHAAARSIISKLPEVVAHPGNREARRQLLIAAAGAGLAIDQCGTGDRSRARSCTGVTGGDPSRSGGDGRASSGVGVDVGRRWRPICAPIADALSSQNLPATFDDLLDAVGFQEELSKWQPPSELDLIAELSSEEHQPMCQNNARPIGVQDHGLLARLTLGWWNR
jgi:alcohol dehydrogenase